MMFGNIGGKIKKYAEILCWIGIGLSVVIALLLVANDNGRNNSAFTGLLLLIIGPLLSWVNSFVLYGFGQLVENSDEIVRHFKSEDRDKKTAFLNDAIKRKTVNGKAEKNREAIKRLRDENIGNDELIEFYCPNCGELVSYTKEKIVDKESFFCPTCNSEIQTKKPAEVTQP